MSQRRVTIGDVATEAGVSIATVSKVINDRYGVAAGTSTRVKAVIEELGYESSLIARSLRSHRTNVLGILVSDIEPFSAELLKGAARAIRTTGYEVIVYSGGGHGEEHAGWERRSVSRLSGTLTDGIILVTPTVDDVGGGTIVAVDPHTGASSMPSVHADNLAGATAATEYLIGLGHRRIGFLAGRPDLESARPARAGLPRRPRQRRHRRRPRPAPGGLVRAGAVARAGPSTARARRTADGDLRRQRPLGDPDDERGPFPRLRRPRRRVRDRLRQHPGVGAHRPAVDDDRPVDPGDG